MRIEHRNQIENDNRFPPVDVHGDQISQSYIYSINAQRLLKGNAVTVILKALVRARYSKLNN